MSGSHGYINFEDEIPANKEEMKKLQTGNTEMMKRPSVTTVPKTQSELTKYDLRICLDKIKEERKDFDKIEMKEDDKSQKNEEHIEQIQQGIDKYVENIKKGIISKPLVIGTGLINICCVRFSPDGKFFAVASGDMRGLRYYNCVTNKLEWYSDVFTDTVTAIQFYDGGQKIIATGNDRFVRNFQTKDGQVLKSVDLTFLSTILTIAINKSENIVAVGATGGTVTLLNWPSGSVAKTIKCHNDYIREVVFDSKGIYLATASDDRKWCVLNVNTKEVEFKSEDGYHDGYILTIAFSPDDKWLATGAADNKIKIYDINKKAPVEFNPEKMHESQVSDLKFGKTNKTLLTCSHDGYIKIWNTIDKGKELESSIFIENYKDLKSIDISPDGTKIVVCSEKHIFLYEIKTGKQLYHYFSGFEQTIKKSLFNSDSSLVLSLSIDENVIRVNDVKTGEEQKDILKLQCLDDQNNPLKDENGNLISSYFIDFTVQTTYSTGPYYRLCASYSRSDGKFGVICFENGNKVWDKLVEDRIIDINYSPDANTLLGGTENKKIYILDNYSGEKSKPNYEELSVSTIYDVLYSTTGSILAFGGSDCNNIFIYETKNDKPPDKTNTKEIKVSHQNYIKQLAISSDEKLIASLDMNQMLVISDMIKKQEIYNFGGENGNSIAFSNDSKRLIAGGKKLNIYDVDTKIKLLSITYRHDLNYVQFSRDGTKLVTAGQVNVIEIFKTDAGEEDTKFFGKPTFNIDKILYNKSEDKFIYINTVREVKICDSKKYKELCLKTLIKQPVDFIIDDSEIYILFVGDFISLFKLQGFTKFDEVKTIDSTPENSTVRTAIFSKKLKQTIIIGSHDGRVRHLDFDLKVLKESDPEKRHTDWIREIVANPRNNNEIFSASDDKSVKVWKEDSLDLLRTIIPGHTSYILSLTLSFDGNRLLTGGNDNNLFVTDATKESNETPIFKLIDNSFHTSGVSAIKFNNKGDQILSTAFGGEIKVWKASDYSLIKEFKFAAACRCNFSKDGSKILSASGGDINLIDINQGQVDKKVKGDPQSTIYSLYFSHDEKKIIAAEASILNILSATNCEILGKIEMSSYNYQYIELYPEVNKFAVPFISGEIKIYDVDSLNVVKSFTIPLGEENNRQELKFIKFLSANKLMLLNSSIKIFDISGTDPKLLNEYKLEKSVDVFDCYLDEKDSYKNKIVFCGEAIIRSHYLNIFDEKDYLKKIFEPITSNNIGYHTVRYAPDGEEIYLLSNTNNSQNEVIVLDSFSGYTIKSHSIKNDTWNIRGTFSPDCNNLAFWNSKHLKILDIENFIENVGNNEVLSDPQVIRYTKDSQKIITVSDSTRISYLDAETPSLMNDFFIINQKFRTAEKNVVDLANLNINQILNKRVNVFTLLGRNYPLNILHYICMYNYENVLKSFLKNVNDDNSDMLYSLLNHRDFLNQTPFQMAVTSGYVNNIETLIKIHIKTKKQSRFFSGLPFQTDTLDIILDYYPSYLSPVVNSQLCSWSERKILKLPLEVVDQRFLPLYESRFSLKENIEKDLNHGIGGKKTDFNCQVLMIEDILLPQNTFMRELSEKLDEDHNIFESAAFAAVLQYKWDNFGEGKFLFSMKKYIIYFLLVLISTLILFPMRRFTYLPSDPPEGEAAPANEATPAEGNTTLLRLLSQVSPNSTTPVKAKLPPELHYDQNAVFIASMVFDIATLIYLIVAIVSYEIKQLVIKKLKYLTESMWNFLDALIILIGSSSMILDIILLTRSEDPDPNLVLVLKFLLFFNLLITWLRMADFWRGFETTAALVRLLSRVFSDMKAFFLVLFYLLIGFAMSTYLLQNNYEEYGKWSFIKMYYNLIIGNGDDFDSMTKTTSVFEDLFFFTFFILTVFFIVVMLNLLISIISDTNAKVKEVAAKAFQYERLNLIIEYEETMSKEEKIAKTEELEGSFLYVIRSSKEVPDEEVDTTDYDKKNKREKLDKMFSEINNNSETIKTIVEDNKNIVELIKKNQEDIKTNFDKFEQFQQQSNTNFDNLKNHMTEEITKQNQKPPEPFKSQPSLPKK